MPNPQNITRPVTLVSYGRSGTSLTQSILRVHPDVDACGETAPLVFGTYAAAERVIGISRPDRELGNEADPDDRCAAVVRAAFLAMFHDPEKPHWMHKPIGVPYVFNHLKGPKRSFREKAAWYWKVIHRAFPDSRTITILRHPYDVVLSAADYWGSTHEGAWRGIVNMARIIGHEESTVDFALSHQRLVDDPDPEVARFLDHVGLPHHPNCFKAPDRVYVPRRNENRIPKDALPDHVNRGFSRKDKWSEIDMTSFTDADRQILIDMWARFGEPLEF